MKTGICDSEEEPSVHGYQHLVCKNPGCGTWLKTIRFMAGWQKEEQPCSDELKLVQENGCCFYRCPVCQARNFVVFEGEKIILEKIIDYETEQNKTREERFVEAEAETRTIPLVQEPVFGH